MQDDTQEEVKEWSRHFCDELDKGGALIEIFGAATDKYLQKNPNEDFALVLSEAQALLNRKHYCYSLDRVFALFPQAFNPDYVAVVRCGILLGEVDILLRRWINDPFFDVVAKRYQYNV